MHTLYTCILHLLYRNVCAHVSDNFCTPHHFRDSLVPLLTQNFGKFRFFQILLTLSKLSSSGGELLINDNITHQFIIICIFYPPMENVSHVTDLKSNFFTIEILFCSVSCTYESEICDTNCYLSVALMLIVSDSFLFQ